MTVTQRNRAGIQHVEGGDVPTLPAFVPVGEVTPADLENTAIKPINTRNVWPLNKHLGLDESLPYDLKNVADELRLELVAHYFR